MRSIGPQCSPTSDGYQRPEEVAAYLGLSVELVRAECAAKRFPHVQGPDGELRFNSDRVVQFGMILARREPQLWDNVVPLRVLTGGARP